MQDDIFFLLPDIMPLPERDAFALRRQSLTPSEVTGLKDLQRVTLSIPPSNPEDARLGSDR